MLYGILTVFMPSPCCARTTWSVPSFPWRISSSSGSVEHAFSPSWALLSLRWTLLGGVVLGPTASFLPSVWRLSLGWVPRKRRRVAFRTIEIVCECGKSADTGGSDGDQAAD